MTTFPEKGKARQNHELFLEEQEENWITHQKMLIQNARRVIIDSDSDEEKITTIVKLNELKDNLKLQLFQALLYIKMTLWRDLNITAGSKGSRITYDKLAVSEMHTEITNFEDKHKYLPSSRVYVPAEIDLNEDRGERRFTERKQIQKGLEPSEVLLCLVKNVFEMDKLVQRNYNLPPDKVRLFFDSNPVQNALKDEILHLSEELATKEAEMRLQHSHF